MLLCWEIFSTKIHPEKKKQEAKFSSDNQGSHPKQPKPMPL